MVEGLACFRVDISQRQKSTVVPVAVDFFIQGVLCGDLLQPRLAIDLDIFSFKLVILILGKQIEANTHKFSSILIPRRTETIRTTKVITTPTTTQPAARKMYSPTIVSLIIGYGLKRHKSAHFRGVLVLVTYPPDPLPLGALFGLFLPLQSSLINTEVAILPRILYDMFSSYLSGAAREGNSEISM